MEPGNSNKAVKTHADIMNIPSSAASIRYSGQCSLSTETARYRIEVEFRPTESRIEEAAVASPDMDILSVDHLFMAHRIQRKQISDKVGAKYYLDNRMGRRSGVTTI